MEILGVLFVLGIFATVAYFLDWYKPTFEWLMDLGLEVQRAINERVYAWQQHRKALAKEQAQLRAMKKEQQKKRRRTIKDGVYTNRKGKTYEVRNGRFERVYWDGTVETPKVGSQEFFDQPIVKEQLEGVQRLFRMQTIKAIYNGTRPPEQVGYGRYTREKLRNEWDDEWEALAQHMGIKLFEYKVIGTQPGTPSEIYGWVDYVEPEKKLNFVKQNYTYDDYLKSTGSGVVVPVIGSSVPPTTTKVIR